MKINYPIKYTAMPIIEQTGWSSGTNELEKEYNVVCFIVSKCYLISDLTKYKEDGSIIKEYEIVFPFQSIDFNKWKETIPTYNIIYGNCINSNKVDVVFDSYEEALNYATVKNDMLCRKIWEDLSYSKNNIKKIQQRKADFNNKLLKYKLLQEQILLYTENDDFEENNKLNRVLKLKNDNL